MISHYHEEQIHKHLLRIIIPQLILKYMYVYKQSDFKHVKQLRIMFSALWHKVAHQMLDEDSEENVDFIQCGNRWKVDIS
jgi:hypothetical protein